MQTVMETLGIFRFTMMKKRIIMRLSGIDSVAWPVLRVRREVLRQFTSLDKIDSSLYYAAKITYYNVRYQSTDAKDKGGRITR